MTTKLRKWGNSEAVRIPKELLNAFHLKEGSTLIFEKTKTGILIKPEHKAKKYKYNIRELCAQITKENRPEPIDWGPDIGREIVEY